MLWLIRRRLRSDNFDLQGRALRYIAARSSSGKHILLLAQAAAGQFGISVESRAADVIATVDPAILRLHAAKSPEFLRLLIRGLGASLRGVRVALPRIGSAAVDELMYALRGSNNIIRAYSAEILGEIGDLRAVDALCHLLNDPKAYVRSAAASALTALAWKPENAQQRLKHAIALLTVDSRPVASLGDVALEQLQTLLADRDVDVRIAAAKALGAMRDVRAIPFLEVALRNSPRSGTLPQHMEENRFRLTCVDALGEIGGSAAADVLVSQQVWGRNYDFRQPADNSLAELDSRLSGRITDVLVQIGKPAVVPVSWRGHGEVAPYVALERIGEPAVPEIARAISEDRADRKRADRKTLIGVLGTIGTHQATEVLLGIAADASDPDYLRTVKALTRTNQAEAIVPLIEALSRLCAEQEADYEKSRSVSVPGWRLSLMSDIILWLGDQGDHRAVDVLNRFLSTTVSSIPDDHVRKASDRALRQIAIRKSGSVSSGC